MMNATLGLQARDPLLLTPEHVGWVEPRDPRQKAAVSRQTPRRGHPSRGSGDAISLEVLARSAAYQDPAPGMRRIPRHTSQRSCTR
jgi:hypothetical protein